MSAAGRLLVLGGSTEASQLTRLLHDHHPSAEVTVSFAGRTASRAPLPTGVHERVGGFGGIDGLRAYLSSERIDAVIDATHPFAARMPFHVRTAADAEGVPALRLVRPPWTPEIGDQWIDVDDMEAAADTVGQAAGRSVLLTIGRQELAPFRRCAETRFVVRSIDPPEPDLLPGAEVVLARGPFTLDDELALLARHHIDLVVAKNAGGEATGAKVDAARRLGIPMVMVRRPPIPCGPAVATPAEALGWLTAILRSASP
jgi:precorrin-6A/cobalt-precorrin-6A reductase